MGVCREQTKLPDNCPYPFDRTRPSSGTQLDDVEEFRDAVVQIPHNSYWKVALVLSVVFHIIIVVYNVLFNKGEHFMIVYIFDMFYGLDWFLQFLLVIHPEKIHVIHEPRNVYRMALDFVSLIPLESLYYMLELNRIIRILRVTDYTLKRRSWVVRWPVLHKIVETFAVILLLSTFGSCILVYKSCYYSHQKNCNNILLKFRSDDEYYSSRSPLYWYIKAQALMINELAHGGFPQQNELNEEDIETLSILLSLRLIFFLFYVMPFFTAAFYEVCQIRFNLSEFLPLLTAHFHVWNRTHMLPDTIAFFQLVANITCLPEEWEDIYPLTISMEKELAMYLHWNIICDSILFKSINMASRRNVALLVKSFFAQPGYVVFRSDEVPDRMIYVVRGIISVMLNDEQPLKFFGKGTCLGCVNLFFEVPSAFTVRCWTLCELFYIERESFLNLLDESRDTREQLQMYFNERLVDAKHIHHTVELLNREEDFEEIPLISPLSWLESKYYNRGKKHKKQEDIEENDEVEERLYTDKYLGEFTFVDAHMPTACQRNLVSESTLMRIWRKISTLIIVVAAFVFPYFACIPKRISWYFISFSLIVFATYCTDLVLSSLHIDKTNKERRTIIKILKARIKDVFFYIDVITIFPIFVLYDEETITHPLIISATLIHCLKLFKLYRYERESEYLSISRINDWVVLHSVLLLLYPIWIFSVFYYSIKCMKGACEPGSWLAHANDTKVPSFISCFSDMSSLATGVRTHEIEMDTITEFLFSSVAISVFCVISVYIFAYFTSKITTQRSHISNSMVFRKHVLHILSVHHVNKAIQNRVNLCLEAICYITDNWLSAYTEKNLHFLPEVFADSVVDVLKGLPLFENGNDSFLNEISDIVNILVLPPGEIILVEGRRSTHFYIINEGLCECFTRDLRTMCLLRKNDLISFVEAMNSVSFSSIVRCVTFCRILAIDAWEFKRIIQKYEEETKYIQDTLEEMLRENLLSYTQSETNLNEDDLRPFLAHIRDDRIQQTNNFCFHSRFLKMNLQQHLLRAMFFLRSLNPHLRIVADIEIFRIFFAILSAVLFSLRRPICLYFKNFTYYVLMLDITAYVDIFLRFRHAYHTKQNVLVTNGLKICFRYLTSSFAIDIIACFPFEVFYGMYLQSHKLSLLQGFLYLNRTLQLYRLKGTWLISRSIGFPFTLSFAILFYTIISLVILNSITAFIFATNCERLENVFVCHNLQDVSTLQSGSGMNPIYAYLYQLMWFLTIFVNIGCDGLSSLGSNMLTIAVLSIFGFGTRLLLYSFFTAYFQDEMVSLHNYQDLIRMLNTFMKEGKVKKRVQNMVRDYYEKHWLLSRDVELVGVWKILHPSLCDEVLFAMFGKRLRNCQVLHDLGDDAVRIVLRIARFEHFVDGTPICHANDVLDVMHCVVKGTVVVESADGQIIGVHEEGTMFGNLEYAQWNRVTISVKAVDDVEVLTIKTSDFYERLHVFSQFKDLMMLYTQYHIDYLLPTYSTGEPSFEEFVATYEKRFSAPSIRHSRRFKFLYSLLQFPYLPQQIITKAVEAVALSATIVTYFLVFIFFNYPNTVYLTVLFYLFDVVHIVAIFHKYHCAYYNRYGKLEKKLRNISERYLTSGEFINDLISLVPLDVIGFFSPAYTSYLRINRSFRINYVFSFLGRERSPNFLRYIITNFLMIVLTVVTILLPLSSIYVLLVNGDENNHFYTFWHGFYTNFNFFALADIQCFPIDKQSLLIYYLIACNIAHGLWIFSIVKWCGVLRLVYSHLEWYSRRARAIMHYIRSRRLPEHLQDDTWVYLRFLWMRGYGHHEPLLVSKAPVLLRQVLRNTVYGPLVRKNGFYRHLHRDFLRQLVDKAKHRSFFPGNVIAIAGVADRSTYFILWGHVEETADGHEQDVERNRTLKDGDVFGIIQGVFPLVPQRYTYRAATKCSILELNYDDWKYLLDFYPSAKHELYLSANSMHMFANS